MPGNPHPVDLWLDDRSAAEGKAYAKLHERVTVADADEVRNTDFTAQYGGLDVRDNAAHYNLDTGSTDADDGVNFIHDAAGNVFVKLTAGTAFTERTVTAAGDVTLETDDVDQINIKKTAGAATRVIMPQSADRTPAGAPLRIVDRKYDAATNNITLVPKRSATITITLATPGVITWTAHGRAVNDPVSFETTGALPTGLTADTVYYVKTAPTVDTMTVSATPGGAAINTSVSQSGVHKAGTDTIMGAGATVIDSNGGSIQLRPLSDETGWS